MNDFIPTVTLKSGLELPALGIGTWKMGEKLSSRENEIAAIRTALDLGMSVIDTAEMYGDGRSELLIGQAIKNRRDDAYLISKVYPWNASKIGIQLSCDKSLANLGVEQLDMYLLHWRGKVPLVETVEALETLKQNGKIRAWGVSNFDTDDMEELLKIENGDQCEVNQILYNLSRRNPEYDLLPWCQNHGITVMAYSPIEQGILTKNADLIHMAKAYQATPAQIAIAFILERDGVMPIPKSSTPDRVVENYHAIDIELSDEDLAILDAAFPPPQQKLPIEMI